MSSTEQCIEGQRVRLLVCCHCLGAAYSGLFKHPSVSALRHFLCLSIQTSMFPLLSCHSAEMKPFLLTRTNYKSINSLSHLLHEVSTDSALCDPDWQLIFKGCTRLTVVSPDLRCRVNPVALLLEFEEEKFCVHFPLSLSVCTTVPVCLPFLCWWGFNPKALSFTSDLMWLHCTVLAC